MKGAILSIALSIGGSIHGDEDEEMIMMVMIMMMLVMVAVVATNRQPAGLRGGSQARVAQSLLTRRRARRCQELPQRCWISPSLKLKLSRERQIMLPPERFGNMKRIRGKRGKREEGVIARCRSCCRLSGLQVSQH